MFAAAVETAEQKSGLRLLSAASSSTPGTTNESRWKLSKRLAIREQLCRHRSRMLLRIGRTTSSASSNLAALRASSAPTSLDGSIRIKSCASHHNLVQRVLDDALGAASLSRGRIRRTADSSRIVLMATQSGSLS